MAHHRDAGFDQVADNVTVSLEPLDLHGMRAGTEKEFKDTLAIADQRVGRRAC